ncbi:MAG: cysteine--tRNA ligase [Actinobacteria bacterium]|nr:cysteine--tRNA ligase [Thermoleophilia bacterium]MCB9011744.1 cysteine--tRNA ligase [Actinomycetota bacterium]
MSDGPRLYNTLSKRVEPLTPGPDGVIGIYVCGPTVYGPIHVGNARPYIVFSVLKRYLTRRGHAVRLVSNLTDINDKIYTAARAEGVASTALAERYGREYIADTDRLELGRPDAEPLVTEHLPEIIGLIERLIDRDLAYEAGGDVYFRVDRFPPYGRLSGRRIDEMVASDPGEHKQHPLDFALWKHRKPDEDAWWDSPWGQGRPGWHIECSAMAEATLGHNFCVHGGGLDLIFPHHENEIAQSEGASGQPMAQIWAHNEMIELGGKMSKSDGNIVLLRDALDRWGRDVILVFTLRTHYRSKLPLSDAGLQDAANQVETLRNAARALRRAAAAPGDTLNEELAEAVVVARTAFVTALDDDFNTPRAFAAVFELVRAINRALEVEARPNGGQLAAVTAELAQLLDMLGLAGLMNEDVVPDDLMEMARARDAARAARDFGEADRLRDLIEGAGFVVRDTPDGPEVTPA